MIRKSLVESSIKKYGKQFKKLLKIKAPLRWHVLSSNDVEVKKLRITNGNDKGISFITSEGSAEIVIFYDTHDNEKDLVGTIFHELLHVRISCITNLITFQQTKGHNREEKFVQVMEKIFIDLYWSQKL